MIRYPFKTNIYRLGFAIVDGSEVETKTIVYSNIPCYYRSSKRQIKSKETGQRINGQVFEVSLPLEYQDVKVGDYIDLSSPAIIDSVDIINQSTNASNVYILATTQGVLQ